MNKKRFRAVDILILEDEQADIDLVVDALNKSKVINKIQIAKNGVEGLECLNKTGKYTDAVMPDLILLDLNMPQKNGMEFLEEVKADERFKHIPIVVMTSSGAEEDIAKSYDLHAACYIQKPLDLGEFHKIVNSLESFWFSVVTLSDK